MKEASARSTGLHLHLGESLSLSDWSGLFVFRGEVLVTTEIKDHSASSRTIPSFLGYWIKKPQQGCKSNAASISMSCNDQAR